MSESKSTAKVKRDRSPAYPAIPLGTAIGRLALFDEYSKRHPVPIKNVGSAWGMKSQSSQASSVLAALKSYGLVDYQGSGADLKVILSENGRTYLRAQQEDIKKQILKQAALAPKAMRGYFEKWGAVRPQKEVCLDELVLNAKFTQAGAENFLKVYDATIAYAGLSESAKMDNEDAEETDTGSGDEEKPATVDQQTRRVPKKPEAGMRQDIFSVDEGAVTIQWPVALSADSLKDIEDWLEIVKRKIARSHQTSKTDEKGE